MTDLRAEDELGLQDGEAVQTQGEVRRAVTPPAAFDVAFTIVASIPQHHDAGPDEIARLTHRWQDEGVAPDGLLPADGGPS